MRGTAHPMHRWPARADQQTMDMQGLSPWQGVQMNRLKALDATFLYAETARMPLHIGSVQILDVPNQRADRFVDDLKDLLRSRSHLLPYLTHRAVDAPLQLDHPCWEACAEIDFDTHLERLTLAPPGDMAQLEHLIADLHQRPLDRSRPLWKTYYIEGLQHGRCAYFNVVHHACIDGLAGQMAVAVLTDPTPEPQSVPPPAEADDEPTGIAEGWSESIARAIAAGITPLARIFTNRDALARIATRAFAAPVSSSLAPPTLLNRAIDATRGYALVRLSLADVKAMGKARGCSANDVFLAICGDALRRYLTAKRSLPHSSLLAGVPVSVRPRADHTMNTQVTMARVSLATHLEDPVRRLDAIHASAAEAKVEARDLAALLPPDVRFIGLPWLERGVAQLWELSSAADYLPPLFNLVISNVPGPTAIRYSNGARILTHFPVSAPAHGAAMNITAHSYAEYFDIGVTVCRRIVPDVTRFRDELLRAYVELRGTLLERRVEPREVPALAHAGIERRCIGVELKVA
jgi:WS/DGAT/MGAT family acyltransferase